MTSDRLSASRMSARITALEMVVAFVLPTALKAGADPEHWLEFTKRSLAGKGLPEPELEALNEELEYWADSMRAGLRARDQD